MGVGRKRRVQGCLAAMDSQLSGPGGGTKEVINCNECSRASRGIEEGLFSPI